MVASEPDGPESDEDQRPVAFQMQDFHISDLLTRHAHGKAGAYHERFLEVSQQVEKQQASEDVQRAQIDHRQHQGHQSNDERWERVPWR